MKYCRSRRGTWHFIVFMWAAFSAGSCSALPDLCKGLPLQSRPVTYDSGEKVEFYEAIYLSGYHSNVIAPPDRFGADNSGERPVRAAVVLAEDCEPGSRLAQKLIKYGVYRVSGRGYYDREFRVFVVDCVCDVEKIENVTPAELRLLQVP